MIGLREHLLEMSSLMKRIKSMLCAELGYRSCRTSCFSTKVHAVPSFPARAVRPTRWTYLRISTGASYDMTCETLGKSIPRAIRSEQISLVNAASYALVGRIRPPSTCRVLTGQSRLWRIQRAISAGLPYQVHQSKPWQ